jgi:shikimate kinase
MPAQKKPELPRPGTLIFVVGFMASGKTRLARHLSEYLGWRFIDTDAEIEKSTGLSVSEIFAQKGEPYFRSLEKKAIAAAASRRKAVVAVGGGSVLNPASVKKMRASGLVIYRLTAFPVLFERAERKGIAKRPLWQGTTVAERRRRMYKLFALRKPHYLEAAHLILRDLEGTPEEAAAQALGRLVTMGWVKP